ncbi:helix-turn-helix domain-containing protein [Flavivirga eckloniae]|uniref:Uncharacterized protein n=1 Tax=Flavivirga eckloniae TaxID=1803846 RepID=A0A2K9PT91_9FLAO|nr:helix-turn-helix transcriptional regulator [Flavivirga eckloniae]AUP80259.1 hypothetical protein C1H87_16720 [Flavivirga eckloniae]
MEFKEKLQQLIKTKYSKNKDLSDKFGMNYTQLSQYVNGKKISIDFLYNIIEEFPDADLNWLLRDDDLSNGLVHEGETPYKIPLTKEQIVDKMEKLVADLKNQMNNKD